MKKKKSLVVIPFVVICLIAGYFLMTPGYTPQRAYEEHFLGPLDAKVTVIEYSDYQCPACRAAYPAVEEMINAYKNSSVKFVYKHFPLSQHQYAEKAAEASECAYDLGGTDVFWQYHNMLFQGSALYEATLKDYAAQLGLDAKKFESCLNSGVMSSRVRDNFNEGFGLGVRGTPSFMINGELSTGLNTLDAFKAIIDPKLGG